ncbi:MAG: hypothetical protein AB7U38_05680 [Hyphomicrobiales bacterium]
MSTVQLALLFAFVMLLGGGWLVYTRSKGWGPWTIQAFGLVLLVPAIVVLAVTQALSKEILATLLGGVAGYIFGRGSSGGPDGDR